MSATGETETGEVETRSLAELRDEIDAIDAEMHRLLLARASVIDSLIKTKGTGRPGAAFRPGREADMMRRFVARHSGTLPLTTVEHIWREIISTFTHMQAPFGVAIDLSIEPDRMRDLARFYFGFSVDLIPLKGPAAVIDRVAEANDLGLIVRDQPASAGAWWRKLVGDASPRIMAILPHIGATKRPADLPAFVISPPLADPTAPDIRIYAMGIAGDADRLRRAVGECIVFAGVSDGGRSDVLVGIPGAIDPNTFAMRARTAGASIGSIDEVGGIAYGIAIDEPVSMLYQGVDRKGIG